MTIRKILEQNSKLSSEQIKEVQRMATDDIKANRINFGKCTHATVAAEIALRCMTAYERCL